MELEGSMCHMDKVSRMVPGPSLHRPLMPLHHPQTGPADTQAPFETSTFLWPQEYAIMREILLLQQGTDYYHLGRDEKFQAWFQAMEKER